jgi:hypothetical protein
MAERYEISVDKITQELAKIGFSNIGNYLLKDAQGRMTHAVDLAQCSAEQLAAVESIQYEEEVVVGGSGEPDPDTGDEAMRIVTRKVKFKLYDKKGALVDLLKQMGGQFDAKKADDPDAGKVVRIEGGLPLPPRYVPEVPGMADPVPSPVDSETPESASSPVETPESTPAPDDTVDGA